MVQTGEAMRFRSRREFGGIAMLAGRAAAQGRKLKVMVTGGHPGDPEYGCGGTIAKFTAAGHAVNILYLNRGGKGCASRTEEACSATRTAEAEKACRILRAQSRFANFRDGEAVVDNASYQDFEKLIVSEAPDVLFTHWPIDNHRDHRAVSLLTYDAWRPMKKRCSLYYYEVTDGEDTTAFSPPEYVNIESVEDLKRKACFAHASQSPERFYRLQSEVSRFRGVAAGCRLAEAFMRHPESPAHVLPE